MSISFFLVVSSHFVRKLVNKNRELKSKKIRFANKHLNKVYLFSQNLYNSKLDPEN